MVRARALLLAVVEQEAGLRPEEASLLGERNSLLHYATKLERAQKEAAESAQRRLDGSVKMVRLFSVLERVHSRTLARRFAVWRMLTFAQVRCALTLLACPVLCSAVLCCAVLCCAVQCALCSLLCC